eukprot:jgi/Ulvmu1/4915/UM201_0007.1
MACERENLFGFEQYAKQCSFFGEGGAPLPEGAGWAIIIGFGFVFSLVTSLIVYVDYTFGGTAMTSEEFNTAGRNIKTGLTASVIVSQWTWAATLLQSSNVAWKFGVSGPFWYASGATIQVLLFAILAIHVKLKAPRAHTILEIVKARWGTTAHLVFMFFAICTNILVSAMLVLGGAAVVNALTGVDLYAASMLIPIGVILYTAAGGLKATFMASYIHTSIVYIALVIFIFKIYASDEATIGSPSKVHDNLVAVAASQQKMEDENPGDRADYFLADNYNNSYLTMLSESGLIFGVINIVGNFGTVFVDQSYWQSAIAASPSSSYKGYILGGLCWFAIPASLATALGLASRALDLPISVDEANAGLVPPAVAVHIMGKGGAALVLIMLFMAVTSTGSAEQIAVSSLFSYDVYREYFNKNATGKDIIRVSRYAVIAYGIFMGILAIILQEIGLSLGWVYLFMGIIIGSAVYPIYCCLTWKKTSALAAISGAAAGQISAIICWLVVCKAEQGEINVDNLGADYPMLAGNVAALGVSCIVTTVLSFVAGEDFDWDIMRNGIKMIEYDGTDKLADEGSDSFEALERALKFTVIYGSALTIVLVVIWPVLALPAKDFTQSYFTFWTIIMIVWGLIAAVAMIFMPIWEAKDSIIKTMANVVSCHKVPHDLPSETFMASKHGGEEWKKQHKEVEKAQAAEAGANKVDAMA